MIRLLYESTLCYSRSSIPLRVSLTNLEDILEAGPSFNNFNNFPWFYGNLSYGFSINFLYSSFYIYTVLIIYS